MGEAQAFRRIVHISTDMAQFKRSWSQMTIADRFPGILVGLILATEIEMRDSQHMARHEIFGPPIEKMAAKLRELFARLNSTIARFLISSMRLVEPLAVALQLDRGDRLRSRWRYWKSPAISSVSFARASDSSKIWASPIDARSPDARLHDGGSLDGGNGASMTSLKGGNIIFQL